MQTILQKTLTALRQAWINWTNYRARRRQWRQDRDAFMQLVWQEDRILADSGLTRDDINWAVSLPLSVNAACALQDRARHCDDNTRTGNVGNHGQHQFAVQPVTRKSTASICNVRVASA